MSEAPCKFEPNGDFITSGKLTFGPKHWFEGKAMTIAGIGPRPKGLRQWARCLWNADIFYGPVPFLKVVALISWLLAWAV